MFDRFFGTNFYYAPNGGDPLLWQHLFWIFGHPEVYILILPAMGMVSEILPVFSRKPLFGYPFVVYATVAIGFIGFGVWSHHMFTTGLGPIANAFFAASTMLIAVPTGVKIFNWIGTMWGGSIRFTTPMLFAIGFVSMFTIGGLTGVMHASSPVDMQHQDSYFVVAHFHYVLFGGAIFGIFGGIYFWLPEVHRADAEREARQVELLADLHRVQPDVRPDALPRRGRHAAPHLHLRPAAGLVRLVRHDWLGWNMVVSIGAFIIAARRAGVHLQRHPQPCAVRRTRPNDPWDGATLEWSLPSPPPVYNFAVRRSSARAMPSGPGSAAAQAVEAHENEATVTAGRARPSGTSSSRRSIPSEEYLAQERERLPRAIRPRSTSRTRRSSRSSPRFGLTA